MDKKIRIGMILLSVVFLIVIVLMLIYDHIKVKPVQNEGTVEQDANRGMDDVLNHLLESTSTSKQTEQVERKEQNIATTNQAYITEKEKEAISIIQKAWDGGENVYFINVGVDQEGRYIVSVNDNDTTERLAWYVVDIETKKYTKQ